MYKGNLDILNMEQFENKPILTTPLSLFKTYTCIPLEYYLDFRTFS